VGRDRNARALIQQVLDSWHRGADARVVCDFLAVERHVEIASDEHLLALQGACGKILHRLLGLGHGDDIGRRADAQGSAARGTDAKRIGSAY